MAEVKPCPMKLSTGQPSTLKEYRKLAELMFPKALPMLDERIKAFGEDEPVVQAESQMLYLFAQIEFNGAPEHPSVIFTKAEGAFENPDDGQYV